MSDNRPSNNSPLNPRTINQLEEIIIRAHFLAMEIRDVCAAEPVAPPEMSITVAAMLKSWAISYSAGLRAATGEFDRQA